MSQEDEDMGDYMDDSDGGDGYDSDDFDAVEEVLLQPKKASERSGSKLPCTLIIRPIIHPRSSRIAS